MMVMMVMMMMTVMAMMTGDVVANISSETGVDITDEMNMKIVLENEDNVTEITPFMTILMKAKSLY